MSNKEEIISHIDKFFGIYYPDVSYDYSYQTKRSETLLKKTYLVNANKINEFDSLSGKLENMKFFISNLRAFFKYEFINYPLFNGLLFNINIPNLSISYTKLESKLGFIKRNFGGIHQDEKYKFWISSDDLNQSYEKLSQLFPFFNYLKNINSDVRLYAYEDELIFLVSSSKNLFGISNHLFQPKLNESELYRSIVKTFNSYFYILKALSLDKSDVEIEQELTSNLLNQIGEENQNR